MKPSLGKLKKFAFHKSSDGKGRRELHRPPKHDELALASQEMEDMRNCYDSLLAAAAATTNSAYEFSESLREMGGCILEKAELYKDNETKKVLMMLGEVQFELQELVDRYRSHIIVTISKPSESLLNELQTVQEMKQQCDEKRSVCEYMIAQQREKGRAKGGKGEVFSLEQLQAAHNEYEEEATLCVFRLKSLKQGQSRSLLTQAARHHTSQLNFFRKGLKSLEAVDPHVKLITEKQHIDYQLGGIDEGDDGEDDTEHSYDSNADGELSFDYRPQNRSEAVATSRNSMELDQEDQSYPKASDVENPEWSLEKVHGDSQMLESEPRASNYSHSAPILAEKKFDPAERVRQMRPSLTQKFLAYVLPTPGDAKSSSSVRTSSVPRSRPTSYPAQTHNIWHSSPLDTKIHKSDSKEDNQSVSLAKADPINEGRNNEQASTCLPPTVVRGFPYPQRDTVDAGDHKKVKRQAFSGPLSSISRLSRPASASGPISASELPQPVSGSLPQVSAPQPSSPKASSRRSPPSISPPKISELHELPRPPNIASSKPATSSASSGLSPPLVSKNSEFPVKNKSISASPLPIPPLTVPRSFSIPSSHYRANALNASKLLESQLQEKDIVSPPLTPISLANVTAVLTSSTAGIQSSET